MEGNNKRTQTYTTISIKNSNDGKRDITLTDTRTKKQWNHIKINWDIRAHAPHPQKYVLDKNNKNVKKWNGNSAN